MTKKRVYELAKELGIENKELISRLEKLGIAVKSHSSTLEDSEVDLVQKEILAPDASELVEKRIKTGVIRRRVIHVPGEETKPDAEEQIPEAVAPAAPPETVKKEAAPPAVPPREMPRKVAASGEAVTVKKMEERHEKAEHGATPRKEEMKPAAAEVVSATAPAPEKAPEPPPRPLHAPTSPPPSAPSAAAPHPVKEAPAIAAKAEKEAPLAVVPKEVGPKVAKKEPVPPAPRPEIKIVPEEPALKADKIVKEEGEKAKKKPIKKQVEVIVDEHLPVRKKAFIKTVVDRKDIHEEERPRKWREEKRAVVRMKKTVITTPKAIKRRLKVGQAITVGDLAKKMGVKASETISKLIALGMMAGINQAIDRDAATIIAAEFGYQVEPVTVEYDESPQKAENSSENLKPRAPVVTIMGHVDHGKTSLLDAIRQTNVIGGEAGGITQAIGAYHVRIKDRDIVFIDTPGHEAFTAMRARGAQVTDIVVLVVAADDGVKDQTVEAINHARSAGVPIIVAVNKIDKPEADPEKIKRELTDHNLMPEEWGGETIFAEVSAKKKVGIEDLLELILLQADMMDLQADPDRPARGVVIEAKLDRGRGPVATILIQEGTLHEGDSFVSKTEYGRVRAMTDDQGRRVHEAGPSMPVEVIGFSGVPQVSAEFLGVEEEKKARNISDYWIRKDRERELSATAKITLEELYQKIREGVKELNVIIKGDGQGSVEALSESLSRLSTADIKLKIIHGSTGAITETDVMLASASNAIIIGFNVRPDVRATEIAAEEGVEIKLYDVIYDAIADVKAAMEGLLEPIFREVVQGRAEVRQLFRVPKVGTIAGSYVTDGKIARTAGAKVVRGGVVVYDGRLASLKRAKDDVREVVTGMECGIALENFGDIQLGDIIESYVKEQEARKL
jgi:translation initiation factor IF-2